LVKLSKDFPAGNDPSTPYEFGIAAYYPTERRLFNRKKKVSTQLRPISARILTLLLENHPEPVSIRTLRRNIWSHVGNDKQFKDCLKTHLDTLRKSFENVGLSRDMIERDGDVVAFLAEPIMPTAFGSFIAGREVGSVPRGVAVEFRDRVAEGKRLCALLLEEKNLRAVNIYGRFGVGKTALAYQTMKSLLGGQKVEGLVCLGPVTGLGLDQIYRHCGLLLGGEPEQTLKEKWENVQIPLSQKIHALVEQLRSRRYIVLLDSLEESMSGGRLLDLDLNQFLEIFLQQPSLSRIVITSNEPLYTVALEAQQFLHHYHLDTGLPEDEAIKFFRSLDHDGSSRLGDIPVSLIRVIFEKTRGFPRALRLVANILYKRPTLSLKDLLQKDGLFDAEITDTLSGEAQAGLDQNERLIMQALAVYNQPVGSDAVASLLESFMSASEADEKLDRLARGKFINVSRDRGEIRFAAHQWDIKLSYGQIQDVDTECGRRSWHLRAADYFARTKPDASAWRTLASLEAPLAEFHHLIKAESYERALAVADAIDANYLSAWGYHQRVISMRETLREHLPAIHEASNLRSLSSAYINAGKYDMAHSIAKQALSVALEHGARVEEANAQLNIGSALYHLSRYKLAERHYEAALATAREVGNKSAEGSALRHLGRLCRNLALHKKALMYYEAALAIAVDTHNNIAKCSALNGIGTAYTEQGLFNEALKRHNEALALARDLNLGKGKGGCLVQAGVAFRESGNYERARESFDEALSIARGLSDVATEMQALGGLGKLHLLQSKFEEALQNILRALEVATELNMKGAQQHWGTYLAQAYLHLGRLRQALRAIEEPLKQDTPWNNYRTSLVGGIVLAKSFAAGQLDAEEGAREAFQRACDGSEKLLTTTPTYYAAHYTRSVAMYGMALLSGKKKQGELLELCRAFLREASRRCSASGVRDDFQKLFGELVPIGPKSWPARVGLTFARKGRQRSS
jgi:tetratricopeptide (TPR) repeat protein